VEERTTFCGMRESVIVDPGGTASFRGEELNAVREAFRGDPRRSTFPHWRAGEDQNRTYPQVRESPPSCETDVDRCSPGCSDRCSG
jgi:hypothetical protein